MGGVTDLRTSDISVEEVTYRGQGQGGKAVFFRQNEVGVECSILFKGSFEFLGGFQRRDLSRSKADIYMSRNDVYFLII